MVDRLSLRLVPDELWALVEALIPEFQARPQGGGTAPFPARAVFTAIVYVLTSGTTFSAGEEISYNLKAQGRAVLVGETTRGGAHPTEVFPITPTFEITVPVARAVNPVTGGNWEGTGVKPDVAIEAESALGKAHDLAIAAIRETCKDPEQLKRLERDIEMEKRLSQRFSERNDKKGN